MVKKTKDQADQKQQAVKIAMEQIEKQYGKGAIMRLGQRQDLKVDVVPTGSIALGLALGIGGLPRGRIVEIYGPEASGKTTLCLHVIAESQKKGGTAAFIDAEHALDPVRAESIGVNLDDLIISQPDTGEQALEIAETLIRSGGLDVICIDSVAALVPKAEIEGEMGDAMIGVQARLMSQAMRKLSGAIAKSKTIMIFTNQLRMKIGIMFGNPETTSGGMALKFYSSVRLDTRKTGNINDGDKVTPLIKGKECAYTYFKEKIAFCGIEKAWEESKIPFRKPLSCHLYPIRVSQIGEMTALNYHRWPVCDPARKLGRKKGLPVFRFLKDALIRAYGTDFYHELETVYEQWKNR